MTKEASGGKDAAATISKMNKRVQRMEDGRILIYYEFDQTSDQLPKDSEEKIERAECRR